MGKDKKKAKGKGKQKQKTKQKNKDKDKRKKGDGDQRGGKKNDGAMLVDIDIGLSAFANARK